MSWIIEGCVCFGINTTPTNVIRIARIIRIGSLLGTLVKGLRPKSQMGLGSLASKSASTSLRPSDSHPTMSLRQLHRFADSHPHRLNKSVASGCDRLADDDDDEEIDEEEARKARTYQLALGRIPFTDKQKQDIKTRFKESRRLFGHFVRKLNEGLVLCYAHDIEGRDEVKDSIKQLHGMWRIANLTSCSYQYFDDMKQYHTVINSALFNPRHQDKEWAAYVQTTQMFRVQLRGFIHQAMNLNT